MTKRIQFNTILFNSLTSFPRQTMVEVKEYCLSTYDTFGFAFSAFINHVT